METPVNRIIETLERQRAYFQSNQTKDIRFRCEQLRKLKSIIRKNETAIQEALWEDLRKSPEEAYLTEISIVLGEIENHLLELKRWTKAKRVPTPLHLFPSSSKIIFEPLGVSLIIAPFNYPFQLVMAPLVGVISSGCCAILKPSPDTPKIALLMEKMIADTFKPEYISLFQGGRETNTHLLQQRFDVIFFTGSSQVGKVVMKAAAEYLTPVILELGGKSPCIVDENANLDKAAKRIIWGKLINAGQTCIAPDYLYVHHAVKDELLSKIAVCIKEMYGEDPQKSRFYPRIVNENAMERLEKLMSHGEIHTGGKIDKNDRYIAPTIIDNAPPDSVLMQEEIFGPILPVMTFKHIDEALNYVRKGEKPLAFYYFGKNRSAKDVIAKSTSGGGCINDALMHITNHHLPFGGVGNSGMGKYHGHHSFLAFSHQRAIVTTPTWIDLPFKYPPFKYFKIMKRII